jgi:hypothetical protein
MNSSLVRSRSTQLALASFFRRTLVLDQRYAARSPRDLVERRQNVALDFRIPQHRPQPTERPAGTAWSPHDEPAPRVPTKSNVPTDPCRSSFESPFFIQKRDWPTTKVQFLKMVRKSSPSELIPVSKKSDSPDHRGRELTRSRHRLRLERREPGRCLLADTSDRRIQLRLRDP